MTTARRDYLAAILAVPCACGPKLKPNQCRVKLAEGGLRESIPGEYLPPDGWEGACVIRPCWELSEAVDERGVGYSMPAECKPQ